MGYTLAQKLIKAHLLDERLDPELRCRLERLRRQGRG